MKMVSDESLREAVEYQCPAGLGVGWQIVIEIQGRSSQVVLESLHFEQVRWEPPLAGFHFAQPFKVILC